MNDYFTIMYFLLVDLAMKSKMPPGSNNGTCGGRDQSTVMQLYICMCVAIGMHQTDVFHFFPSLLSVK